MEKDQVEEVVDLSPRPFRIETCCICGQRNCAHLTGLYVEDLADTERLKPDDDLLSLRVLSIFTLLANEVEQYLQSKALKFKVNQATNGLGVYIYLIGPKMLDRVILPELIRICWKRGLVVASDMWGKFEDGVFFYVGSRYVKDIHHWRSEDPFTRSKI